MLRSLLKIVLALLAALVLLGTGAFAWMKLAPRRVPDGQPPLATLGPESLDGFREAFHTGQGRVRILALLSPT